MSYCAKRRRDVIKDNNASLPANDSHQKTGRLNKSSTTPPLSQELRTLVTQQWAMCCKFTEQNPNGGINKGILVITTDALEETESIRQGFNNQSGLKLLSLTQAAQIFESPITPKTNKMKIGSIISQYTADL